MSIKLQNEITRSFKNRTYAPCYTIPDQDGSTIGHIKRAQTLVRSMDLSGKILEERYKIEAVLGTGGMGTVYKAFDLDLAREIAIKILNTEQLLDDDSVARFEREGKILSALSHKHIATFYRFGVSEGSCPYIAMEFLSGATLRQILNKESRIHWTRAIAIGIQICDALQYAHQQGLVHRDLKPENVMLLAEPAADFVKILDFGLAKKLGDENELQKLTLTGQLIGTVNYLSPEQCLGQQPDSRSDIYSLACILYECILGAPPFTTDSPVGVIYMHVNQTAKPISNFSVAGGIPEELEHVISKAMSKNLGERYQSMAELKEHLELLLDGQAPLTGSKLRLPRQNRNEPFILKMKFPILIVLALSLGGFIFLQKKNQRLQQVQLASMSLPQEDQAKRALDLRTKQIEQKTIRMQKRLNFSHLTPAEKQGLALTLVDDLLKLAMIHAENGGMEQAAQEDQLALKYAPLAGPRQEFAALLAYGSLQRDRRKLKEADELFARTETILESSGIETSILRANFSFQRCFLHIFQNRMAEARQCLAKALELWKQDSAVDTADLVNMKPQVDRTNELHGLCRVIDQHKAISVNDKVVSLIMINQIIEFGLDFNSSPMVEKPIKLALKLVAEIPDNTDGFKAARAETNRLIARASSKNKAKD